MCVALRCSSCDWMKTKTVFSDLACLCWIAGAGFGFGLPGLQFGLGFGAGFGIGIGFGYGVGKGCAYDENGKHCNLPSLNARLRLFLILFDYCTRSCSLKYESLLDSSLLLFFFMFCAVLQCRQYLDWVMFWVHGLSGYHITM